MLYLLGGRSERHLWTDHHCKKEQGELVATVGLCSPMFALAEVRRR